MELSDYPAIEVEYQKIDDSPEAQILDLQVGKHTDATGSLN